MLGLRIVSLPRNQKKTIKIGDRLNRPPDLHPFAEQADVNRHQVHLPDIYPSTLVRERRKRRPRVGAKAHPVASLAHPAELIVRTDGVGRPEREFLVRLINERREHDLPASFSLDPQPA